MMAGFGDRQAFSTASVPVDQSLRIWREYMREVWFSLEIDTRGAEVRSGRLAKRQFAATHVSALASDAQRVIRSRQLANADKNESFCLVFPTSGTFEYRQRGGEAVARHGDVYILNANEPYEVDIAQGSQMLCLTLPCDLVRARVKDVDDLCGKSRFADPALVSTLRHLVETTLEIEPSVDATRLQNLCLDMIDMMVVRGPRKPMRSYVDSVAAQIIDRTAQLIDARLSDPQFRIAEVAKACGVSVRLLQSAYQKRGTTFGAELLKARLCRAQRLLAADDRWPGLIGEVAVRCGFVSQAHFATSYRGRFGHTPRDEPRHF